MKRSVALTAMVCIALSGCCLFQQSPKDAEFVTASDIINALKEELAAVKTAPASYKMEVSDKACGKMAVDKKNYVLVAFSSMTAQVLLSTVNTDALAVNAGGAKVPIGAVLLSPKLTLTSTNIHTQNVTYSFDKLQFPATDFSQAVELLPPPAAKGKLPVHHFGGTIDSSEALVTKDGKPLASPPATAYGIAAAILAARDEIMRVDHMQHPCVQPQSIKVEVKFQVQRKADLTTQADIILFSAGFDASTQRENANSLTVIFDTTGSSAAFD